MDFHMDGGPRKGLGDKSMTLVGLLHLPPSKIHRPFLGDGPNGAPGGRWLCGQWTLGDGQSSAAGWQAPPQMETPGVGGYPRGKNHEAGREGIQGRARKDRPVTTIWAFARPVPALLTAVHSYTPSSVLEARGISQLLFPDTLQIQNS